MPGQPDAAQRAQSEFVAPDSQATAEQTCTTTARRAQTEFVGLDSETITRRPHTAEADLPLPDQRSVVQPPSTTEPVAPDPTLATQRADLPETEETELPARRTGSSKSIVPDSTMATEGAATLNEDEEMLFLKMFGGMIPSATTDVPYVSNTFVGSGKSKADSGLTSISFGLEWKLLRARVGAHRKPRTLLPRSSADGYNKSGSDT